MTEVAVGDRVAMPWLGYACGNCDYCVSGRETLCLGQEMRGYTIDGAMAVFGDQVSREVALLLAERGIDLVTSAYREVRDPNRWWSIPEVKSCTRLE